MCVLGTMDQEPYIGQPKSARCDSTTTAGTRASLMQGRHPDFVCNQCWSRHQASEVCSDCMWTFLSWLQPTFVHFGVDEDTYVWGTDVLSIHNKYCIVLPRSTDFASVAPFSHLGPQRHFQRSSFRICWSKLRANFLPIQTSLPT